MSGELYLVLGAMPEKAEPDTHIAAGPWCFAGREDLFPGWEKRFSFAPEPLADASRLPGAARAAQILCVAMISRIARLLCPDAGKFPPAYWRILLEPWAVDVARQIVERVLRCEAMREKWGDVRLRVALLPEDCQFNFRDEHDFTLRGGLGLLFNHWLFSRLLELDWPAAWEKIILPAETVGPEEKVRSTLRGRLTHWARTQMLKLPFPRLKGMSFWQSLLFSLSLMHGCLGPDHSVDMKELFDKEDLPESLRNDFLNIFQKCLPRSLRELNHGGDFARACRPRLRVASIIAYENAAYRQELARWRAKGNRLAYAQHGGNYGQAAVVCDTQLVEYAQDVFFTWGWRKHGGSFGNFIPMPVPQLSAIANKWHPGKEKRLLFVGTEMAAYGYRLDSRPTPLQFLDYRECKKRFFSAIGQTICGKTLYRPYFSLPGTLTDWEWLSPQFPELERCTGQLLSHLLSCHILVLDHHGTTMLEAMAANVPMILFWEKDRWPLVPECVELLEMLRCCGIWHSTPEEAALFAQKIWCNPMEWWLDAETQNARLKYCQCQARWKTDGLDGEWTGVLRKL